MGEWQGPRSVQNDTTLPKVTGMASSRWGCAREWTPNGAAFWHSPDSVPSPPPPFWQRSPHLHSKRCCSGTAGTPGIGCAPGSAEHSKGLVQGEKHRNHVFLAQAPAAVWGGCLCAPPVPQAGSRPDQEMPKPRCPCCGAECPLLGAHPEPSEPAHPLPGAQPLPSPLELSPPSPCPTGK